MNEPGDALILIPPERLPSEVMSLTDAELQKKTELHWKTIRKIRDGIKSVKKSSYVSLLTPFGYSVDEIRQADRFDGPTNPPVRISNEWSLASTLTPVLTAANGLQYRIYQLRHEHTPGQFGRGKRYDISHFTSRAKTEWLPKLVRHSEVCGRIRHPRVPIHHSYFPASNVREVWWVVDEWIPGRSLSEMITTEDPVANIPLVALQIAEGLLALHESDIVLRDLSPEKVWIGKAGVLLTDFELAKLSEGEPTVSKSWPFNPYHAPELGAQTATPQADLYSWSHIVMKLVLGDLPLPREIRAALASRKLPSDLVQLLERCASALPSKRPKAITEVLPVVQNWVKVAPRSST